MRQRDGEVGRGQGAPVVGVTDEADVRLGGGNRGQHRRGREVHQQDMGRVQARGADGVVGQEHFGQLHHLDMHRRQVDPFFLGGEKLLSLAGCDFLQAGERHRHPGDHRDILFQRPALVADLVGATVEIQLAAGAIGAAEKGDQVGVNLALAGAVDGDELEFAGAGGLLDPFLQAGAEPFAAKPGAEIADQLVKEVAIEPFGGRHPIVVHRFILRLAGEQGVVVLAGDFGDFGH